MAVETRAIEKLEVGTLHIMKSYYLQKTRGTADHFEIFVEENRRVGMMFCNRASESRTIPRREYKPPYRVLLLQFCTGMNGNFYLHLI